MNEIWKPIDNFENYSVSTYGIIRNNVTGKILKKNIKEGYHCISLVNINKVKKCFKVHRLVALAFIDNLENKTDVNHKDKNKLNNNITNLEWMTRKENNIHRCKDTVIKQEAKNKQIFRLDSTTNETLEEYNSIQDAGVWAKINGFTANEHNGRNSIGNCISGLSNKAYGFKWVLKEEPFVLDGEVWKQVPDILDICYVSSLGRFKNSKGIIITNRKPNISGYIPITLCGKTYRLHRIIANAFIDNPDNKEQVNHMDGNKINNCISNLEWVTNQENQIHKFKTGLGNNQTRKICQYDLENNFIKIFPSIISASKEINVCKSCVQGVLGGRRKTTGGFIWKYLD